MQWKNDEDGDDDGDDRNDDDGDDGDDNKRWPSEAQAATQSECRWETGERVFCSGRVAACRRVSNFGLIHGGIHESEGRSIPIGWFQTPG